MKKRITILCALLMVVMSLAACDSSGKDYKEAMSLYENQQYDEALAMFEELGEYEDSQNMILACRYGKAAALYESGDYTEAKKAFEELGDYEDSADMAASCTIREADQLLEEGKTAEALAVYQAEYAASKSEDALKGICACGENYLKDGDYETVNGMLEEIRDTEEGKQLSYASLLVGAKDCIEKQALSAAQKALKELPEDFTFNNISAAELLAMLSEHQEFVDVNGIWNSEDGAHLTMRWESPDYWEEYTGDVSGSTTLSILSDIQEDGNVKMQGEIQIPLLSDLGKSIETVTGSFEYVGTEFPDSIDVTFGDTGFDGTLTYEDGVFTFSYVYDFTASNGFQYKYTGTSVYKTLDKPQ